MPVLVYDSASLSEDIKDGYAAIPPNMTYVAKGLPLLAYHYPQQINYSWIPTYTSRLRIPTRQRQVLQEKLNHPTAGNYFGYNQTLELKCIISCSKEGD